MYNGVNMAGGYQLSSSVYEDLKKYVKKGLEGEKRNMIETYYVSGNPLYVGWDNGETVEYSIVRTRDVKKNLGIERVVLSPPENPVATIFFWNDGDKTVVKTMEGDEYNFETALHQAMIEKFIFDNKKTQKNNFLHGVMKAYHYTLANEGHIEDFIDSKYTSCPWCSREVATEKNFTGEITCQCEEKFSVNKNGLSKKL